MQLKIGFIGLGQMGSAIAANLIKAGHEVTLWNRSSGKADDLIASGAALAQTPLAAATGTDAVFTMLADDGAVESVVYGEDGILEGSALHISLSTISIALADRLARDHASRGGYISAPVFGRPPAAMAGKLFVVAAGAPENLDLCEPLFSAIGQRTFRLGDKASSANVVKLSGNFMIMAAIEAMAEAMTFAEKNGVARNALNEIMTGTIFNAPIYHIYGEILAEDRYRPAGFTAPLGLKDMTLVDRAATDANVAMPTLGILRDHLRAAIAQEGEDIDWTGVALTLRRNAGLD